MSKSSSFAPGKVLGSCACRRITFETKSVAHEVTACYCRECAKLSGAGYLPFAHFLISDVKWSIEPDIWKSSDFAERGYCKACGSAISMRDFIDPQEVGIVLSMIDTSSQPLPRPQRHIFLEEKADWVQVPEDDSKKFNKHHPAFQARFDEWQSSKK